MKERPNKLNPFAERLEEWAAEGKTLEQMRQQLLDDGCSTSLSSLSDFLARRREARMQEKLFESIASGGQMNKKLDQAYEQNPAPGLERLIEVSKTLVMSLQVKGTADPEMLKLAKGYLDTVLNYVSGRTKAENEKEKLAQGARRLAMLENSHERAKAELQKLRDPNAKLTDEERQAIVNTVDEILGIK